MLRTRATSFLRSPWAFVLVPALALAFVACSSTDDRAPLGGGGVGGTIGGSGGGGGGGSSGGDAATTTAESVLGLVTFLDTPAGVAAGSLSSTQISAQFLEGAYGDGGTTVGAVVLPAGCTQTSATDGDTTCSRIDCPQVVSTDPIGVPESAGALTLSGTVGADTMTPTSGVYTTLTSTDVPFWQPGGALGVSAAGDVVPAFTASLSAVPSLTLAEPAPLSDGTRPLSRSVGFAFRISETVQTLRLTLAFNVVLEAGTTRVAYECSAPGTTGLLTVPAELVTDIPDDAVPSAASLLGEISTSAELGPTTAPVGIAIVAARRIVVASDLNVLDWTTFGVIP